MIKAMTDIKLVVRTCRTALQLFGWLLVGTLLLTGCHDLTHELEGRMAFASERDGDGEIYLMNADGSQPIRLTSVPGPDLDPVFSPDGTRIAFCSGRDGNNREIYIMQADGTDQTNVTNHPNAYDCGSTWSPHGTQLAFASNRDSSFTGSNIYVMQADGSEVIRLTESGEDFHPDWAPDGTQIVFVSARDGEDIMYLMEADGARQQPIDGLPPGPAVPTWSPDGTRIAFIAGSYEVSSAIYTVRPDGSDLQKLTEITGKQTYSGLCWSPDGEYLAFTIIDSTHNDFSGPYSQIYIMRADGSGQVRLSTGDHVDYGPTWAP